MFFHGSLFVSALFFWGMLQGAIAFPEQFFFFSGSLLFAAFWISKKLGGSFEGTVLPTLFTFSVLLLFFFVSLPQQKQIFTFLSSGVFYLSLLGIYRRRSYGKDETARGILSLVSMTTLFFFLSGIYGLFLNFQFFSEPFLMLSSAGSVFLVGRNIFLQYFRNAPEKARFFAFFLALFSGEMAWVSSFWPFGYLTVGAVSLLFLSVLWDTLLLSLQRTITLRRLLVQLSVLVLFLGLVLSSSIWRPVV